MSGLPSVLATLPDADVAVGWAFVAIAVIVLFVGCARVALTPPQKPGDRHADVARLPGPVPLEDRDRAA